MVPPIVVRTRVSGGQLEMQGQNLACLRIRPRGLTASGPSYGGPGKPWRVPTRKRRTPGPRESPGPGRGQDRNVSVPLIDHFRRRALLRERDPHLGRTTFPDKTTHVSGIVLYKRSLIMVQGTAWSYFQHGWRRPSRTLTRFLSRASGKPGRAPPGAGGHGRRAQTGLLRPETVAVLHRPARRGVGLDRTDARDDPAGGGL